MRTNPLQTRCSALPVVALLAALLSVSSVATAQNLLGTAQNFGVLGAATVTNTGLTSIRGDLGVSPGSAITGFFPGTPAGPGIVFGTTHSADAAAATARADAIAAFAAFNATPFTTDLSGLPAGQLGGLTLTPGVYFLSSSAQLTGNLNLDFQGLANASFLFRIGSTLTTASASSVTLTNVGTGAGLYWAVGSSATLGTGTDFWGNIIANASVTLTTGAQIVCGRAIALNGAVTLDANLVSNNCANGGDFGLGHNDFGSLGLSSAVPEPSTLVLLVIGGCLALPLLKRARHQS